MKYILLINVKIPTIVVILTFISMINTTSERHKARNFLICRSFSVYEHLKFHAQLSIKKIFTSGPGENLICMIKICLFELMLYIPVNSFFTHVEIFLG